MAKTTKRKQRPKAPAHVRLTPDAIVERDMRRSHQRQKRIGQLQTQLRRQLEKNRRGLTEFCEWLIAAGHAMPYSGRPPADSSK